MAAFERSLADPLPPVANDSYRTIKSVAQVAFLIQILPPIKVQGI
jgi:hypothetical protein